MIEKLVIQNIGSIADAEVAFGPGFTVITGETGAGKTMLLSALEMLFGAARGRGLRSQNAQQILCVCRVDSQVAEGLASDSSRSICADKTLVIKHQINPSGKSNISVNGQSANKNYLKELQKKLFVIHGQFKQVELKSPTLQREILDAYAENAELLEEYRKRWNELDRITLELSEILDNAIARRAEAAGLLQAIQEIDEVDPRSGEDESIKAQINILENHEKLLEKLREVKQLLADNGVIDKLAEVQQGLREIDSFGIKLESSFSVAIENAVVSMQELSDEITRQIGGVPEDSADTLDGLHHRLSLLRKLQKKYGPSIDNVIAFANNARIRHDTIENDDTRAEELDCKKRELQGIVESIAKKLSERRSTAAQRLGQVVSWDLPHLAMPEAQFSIDVVDKPYDSYGKDHVTMLLKTAGAVPPQPLGVGPSGGEVSRVMLALEVALANLKTIPTIIFDEIDSGVGGAAAIEIGKRLAALGRRVQVIVITHSAQVAAFAATHLLVAKSGGVSSIRALRGEERVHEMARLLSGLHDSESGLAHSRELLNLANEF